MRRVVEELVDGACGAPDFDTRAVLRVLDLHEHVQLVAQVLPLRLAAMRVLLRIGRREERVRNAVGRPETGQKRGTGTTKTRR